MKHKPLNQLYHQFLAPKGIHADLLPEFVDLLNEHGFIKLTYWPEHPTTEPRYVELPKLTSREHKDELFRIVQATKEVSE